MDTDGYHNQGVLSNTRKRPNLNKSWFFTFNNYEEKDIDIIINKLDTICDRYIFEKENGSKNETPHLQGVIFLKEKMRWTEFKLSNKIHWMTTKNEQAAIKYCQKEYHWNGNQIWSKDIKICRNIFEIPIKTTWVTYIEDIVKNEIYDERSIHWFWSQEGAMGKTKLMKYLYQRYKAILISSPTNAKDMMNLVYNNLKDTDKVNTIVIDLPRSYKSTSGLYEGLESIKNGIISNLKSYKNDTKCFARPNIFVLANFRPTTIKMSKDRWIIHQIDFMNGVKFNK